MIKEAHDALFDSKLLKLKSTAVSLPVDLLAVLQVLQVDSDGKEQGEHEEEGLFLCWT